MLTPVFLHADPDKLCQSLIYPVRIVFLSGALAALACVGVVNRK